MTEFLITGALFIAAFGCAGIVCWVIDRVAQKRQADWNAEGNARGVR